MLERNNDMILEKMEHFILSGCEEFSDYNSDYKLSQMFMYSVCSNMTDYWKSFCKDSKKSADNMKLFL